MYIIYIWETIYTEGTRFLVVSVLVDGIPSIAGNEGIDWPVMICNGDFFGGREHLLLEREGNCEERSQRVFLCIDISCSFLRRERFSYQEKAFWVILSCCPPLFSNT